MVDMCECTHKSFSPGHHFSFVQWLGHGIIVVFQLLNHVWLFVTPCTVAHQASLSFTIFQSLLELMSIETMMPSNHLILCRSLLLLPSVFPRIRVFPKELALCIRCPQYWSFSFSIIPSNEYSGRTLGWTGWISLQSKGLWRVFFSSTWKHRLFIPQPSLR